MLKAYKNKKNKILSQYDKIIKLPNILSQDTTIQKIKAKREQLKEEHFFVSFTGQIKAGKSTLINALIFGEEVIPADDIPHTAKITIIKYGKKPKLEVTFYDKDEWDILQSNQEFYQEYLEADIEKSISNGLFVEEIIHKKAKTQKEKNLKNLKEYVARGGKYTPFVNFVTLYYPNKILKQVTIVDTPGTNDPNKLRDKVAKKWIDKTNANIYITYANQAMDAIDIDFIDNFLLTVPKEQKLTVVNKIDSVNDTDGLEEYISELLEDESLRKREIVSDRESLVLVSGLGALIDKMLTKNLPLGEDLDYYAEQLDEKGFLEPENHQLSNLEKMIEQKLIENKGKNIIDSHTQFLNSIFENKIIEIKKSLEKERSRLSDLFKTTEELNKKLDNIELSKRNLVEGLEILSIRFSKKLKDIFEKRKDDFSKIKRKNIEYSGNKIKEIKNSSNYKNEVLWILKEALDINYEDLKELISDIRDEMSHYIDDEVNNFKTIFLQKSDNIDELFYSIDIYTQDLTKEVSSVINQAFSTQQVNDIVVNSHARYQWLDTKTKLGQINSALKSRIEKFFEEEIDNLTNRLEQKLDKHITDNVIVKMKVEIDNRLTDKEKELKNYLHTKEDKSKLIRQSQNITKELEKDLEEIDRYRKEILGESN